MVQKPASLHPCEWDGSEKIQEITPTKRGIRYFIVFDPYEYITAKSILKDRE
jgi:hypothetical protein